MTGSGELLLPCFHTSMTSMEGTVVCPISPFGFGTEATDEMENAANDGDQENRGIVVVNRLILSDGEMVDPGDDGRNGKRVEGKEKMRNVVPASAPVHVEVNSFIEIMDELCREYMWKVMMQLKSLPKPWT